MLTSIGDGRMCRRCSPERHDFPGDAKNGWQINFKKQFVAACERFLDAGQLEVDEDNVIKGGWRRL